jgi:ribosomal protein S18 acetylase RimI-like enzyme
MKNESRITFSWASPEELPKVWQLFQDVGTTWPHPQAFFEESLTHQRLLLAYDDATPVAYLVYQIIWGNTAFLSLLKVLTEYQRTGIGTAMVGLLEKRLVSQGFASYVTSSEPTNQHTKRFLPALGFAQIGELRMYHGGELFYLKDLPPKV